MRNMKKHSELGAIMLEVIAVLSLMGLMGTMLFRQIYKRNQELHNIQLASEIRIIKEAFSAYIQANGSEIICTGGLSATELHECSVPGGSLAAVVKDYLPQGFLAGSGAGLAADTLDRMYHFELLGYLRGPQNVAGQGIRTFLGVVAPKKPTLPDGICDDRSAWNTRRAARIAMLIGSDGGLYSLGVTAASKDAPDDIAGTIGTWHLDTETVFGGTDVMYSSLGLNDCKELPPIYLAITELDVYSPDIDVPDQRINLGDRWGLALDKGHVYDEFRVGGKDRANCYQIQHHLVDGSGNVTSDILLPVEDCAPAFWVKPAHDSAGDKGNVYVLNDLHVGADPNGEKPGNIVLTKDGDILLPELAITKDGRIISKNEKTPANLSEHGDKNYELDLAYTSTMNDIRLASRGGARLSEILPDYILKDVRYCPDLKAHTCKINGPDDPHKDITCPSGYKWAVVITPRVVSTPQLEIGHEDISAGAIETGSLSGTGVNGSITIDNPSTLATETSSVSIPRTGKNDEINLTVTDSKVVTDDTQLTELTNKLKVLGQVKEWKIYLDESNSNSYDETTPKGLDRTEQLTISVTATDYEDQDITSSVRMDAVVQTYCVFIPDDPTTPAIEGVQTTNTIRDEDGIRADRFGADTKGSLTAAEATCTAAGMTWDGMNKKCVMPSDFGNAKSASVCHILGGKWELGACHEIPTHGGEEPEQP